MLWRSAGLVVTNISKGIQTRCLKTDVGSTSDFRGCRRG
ncbi:hypothetical protein RSAG8_10412, partial [Rhizoctonia solani AG-8 WAC10335]